MSELLFAAIVLWYIVIGAILSWIFQWLWNTTMPAIFPVPPLTFWQALRVLLIAGILFGGGSRVVATASTPFSQLTRSSVGAPVVSLIER